MDTNDKSHDESHSDSSNSDTSDIGEAMDMVSGACSRGESSRTPISAVEGQVDLGTIVQEANGSWDRLRAVVSELPNEKRKQYLSNHSKPSSRDILHYHPVTKNGKTWNVSFQLRWLERFPWLSYSRVLSGGICRYCILFPEKPARGEGLGSGSRSGVLTLSPYQSPYSKALGKDGVLISHANAIMHHHSTQRADDFLRNILHPDKRIDSLLAKQSEELADENKHILSQIILAIEFLAKQGLAFRGHRDDKVDFSSDETNRGNFVATLQLMAKNDAILCKHLSSAKRNAKYTSKTIQNQIIHIYASKIQEKITKPVKDNALPYTIIADETTSVPANPRIRECLLTFLHLQRTNAEGISKKILEALSQPCISLDPTRICGQAYDGASVMSSCKSGVQAKIREICPKALYTHCYSHCLNLSITASCAVQEVRNLIAVVNEAHLFLSKSPKRQKMFELTVTNLMPTSSHSKLPGLCKTRWVERHTCFDVFLELYEPLVTFLDAIMSPHQYPELQSSDGDWKWDSETRVRAQGLKASLSSFQMIATFIITKSVLDEVKSLSSKLQKRDQDVYEALTMVKKVIKELTDIRSNINDTFSLWYTEILSLADSIGVSEEVPRKTSLQRNRSNIPSSTPQEHYKRTVVIPLLDSLIAQLNDRFEDSSDKYVQALLSLIPSVLISPGKEMTEAAFSLWRDDLPLPKSLSGELVRWKRLWISSSQEAATSKVPSNLLEALQSCDKDSFQNIYYLLTVGCALPITSAEAERTFSLLRRIKTYTRSMLTEEHFSDLAVIAMHYKERIPTDEMLKAFIQANPRRIFEKSLLDD